LTEEAQTVGADGLWDAEALEGLAVSEPAGSKLVEPAFSYMEELGDLAFFIAPIGRF
jgi:hypothetical protein